MNRPAMAKSNKHVFPKGGKLLPLAMICWVKMTMPGVAGRITFNGDCHA
jgi:hypothetical protein